MNTTIVPHAPAVQATPAQDAYRAHVNGDCWPCSTGHWCTVADRLDYLAAREDTRREAHRG